MRPRPLHRERRVRRGARVHRLEPADRPARSPTIRRPTTSSSTTPSQHDTTRQDLHLPDLRRQRSTIPARAAADGMQDGIDFITALANHPETGATAGAQAVELLRQRSRRARPSFVERCAPASICRAARASRPRPALHAAVARGSTNPGNCHTRYSWPVEFVVRPMKEVGWAGFSRRHGAVAAHEHGADAVRAAGRRGLGARRRLVLDRRHAGADELRGDAARTRSSTWRAAASGADSDSPSRVLDVHARSADAGAARARTCTTSCSRYLERRRRMDRLRRADASKAAGLARLIVGSGEYQFV